MIVIKTNNYHECLSEQNDKCEYLNEAEKRCDYFHEDLRQEGKTNSLGRDVEYYMRCQQCMDLKL